MGHGSIAGTETRRQRLRRQLLSDLGFGSMRA
jgi:hypothetical protein